MTKSIKRDLENKQQDHGTIVNKMDDVFSKLGDLEQKLAQMDQVMAKIDQLGIEVQQIKPETPVEKLEMRSLDSYPFNEKPAEFFDHKQDEMRASGKNEYVLTKDDVENYNPTIKASFNPEEEKDEYSY
jgi:protein subunit release factor A